MKTLYVHRKLLNSDEFITWIESKGFQEHLEPNDFHVTVAFSKKEVDWDTLGSDDSQLTIHLNKSSVEPLGDKGAVVLKFKSETLKNRWQYFIDNGCSWDYPDYHPHITITYNSTNDVDLSSIDSYNGKLVFGPEIFEEVNDDWTKDKK